MRRAPVVIAALAVAAAAVVWSSASDDGPDPFDPPALDVKVEREAPDEDTVRARRLEQLRAMMARRHEQTRQVKVSVLGCGLMPAPRAVVSLDVGGQLRRMGEADDMGRLVLTVPQEDRITVVADHQGQTGGSEPTTGDEVNVVACPGATVVGKVVDDAGRPVGGVEVVLGEEQDVAVTDEEGRFLLTDLYLTAPRVRARSDVGRAELALEPPLAPDEEREVTLRLEEGRRLVGLVVDESDAPASYARVEARDADGRVVATARADRSGRFWLKRVPLVPVTLTARLGAAESAPLTVPVALEGDDELVLTLRPRAILLLSGGGSGSQFVVFDASVPGQREVASASGPEARVSVAPGRFEVVMLEGEVSVECGYVSVPAGGETKVVCGGSGGATVVGRLLRPDGSTVSGARVMLGVGRRVSARGTSSGDGRFELQVPDVGNGWLRARSDEGDQVWLRNVALAGGAVTDLGDVTLVAAETMQELREPGPFGGIGGAVGHSDHGIAFVRIVSGGPLDKAGIRKGDVLLKIGDDPTASADINQLVQRLRGAEGSTVDLTIFRDGKEQRLSVTRETIDVQQAGWRE